MHSLALIRSATLAQARSATACRRSAALRVASAALFATTNRAIAAPAPTIRASPACTRPFTSSSSSSSASGASPPSPAPSALDLDASFTSGTPISGSELAALIRAGRTGVDKDVLVIDVRNPDEHAATGLIPTAVPLPLPELQAALQEPNMQFQLLNGFPKPSREASNLVMYCKAGVRADMAAQVARGLGFKRVRSYKGSWIEWSREYANVVPEDQGSAGPSSSS